MVDRIHVIDPEVRRRAKVARELCCHGKHVEIYEDVLEFLAVGSTEGLVLAADDREVTGNPLEDIRAAGIGLPIIAYAETPPVERVVQVMLAGVAGYLSWPFDNRELLGTLDRMLEANTGRQRRDSAMATARAQVEELTPREREVLTAIVAGMSNKEIASVLGISPRTVEIHRSNMMMRLHANSVAAAVKIGLHAGLDQVRLLQGRAA